MFGKTIQLDPANPNMPLPHLWSGRGSRAMILVVDHPADSTALFIFTAPGASESTVIESDVLGNIYINGWSLDFSAQVTYEIVARDENGSTSMGKGLLTVYASATSGTIPTPPPLIPPDTYILNPVTGLYHKITATINDLGEPTIDVGPGEETPNA